MRFTMVMSQMRKYRMLPRVATEITNNKVLLGYINKQEISF